MMGQRLLSMFPASSSKLRTTPILFDSQRLKSRAPDTWCMMRGPVCAAGGSGPSAALGGSTALKELGGRTHTLSGTHVRSGIMPPPFAQLGWNGLIDVQSCNCQNASQRSSMKSAERLASYALRAGQGNT